MSIFFMLTRLIGGWLLLAVIAGLVSGFSNASLLALINHSLALTQRQEWLGTGLKFTLLALLMLVSRVISETTFVFLGQKVKAHLRSDMIRHVSKTPWQKLQQVGMAKAISIFTQDLDTLVVFFVSLPNLFIYGAVIVGCLIYLGMLSLLVLCLAMVAILMGSLGYRIIHSRAILFLRQSRSREDLLMQQYKKLFDGGREFRLNTRRLHDFVDGQLTENIEAVRRERTRGYVLYGLATSWGSILFFAFIGIVIYALRGILALDSSVTTGYAIVFLYMIVPVQGLLSALPAVSSARVALQRVQDFSKHLPSEDAQRHLPPEKFSGVELKNITYRYHGENGDRFSFGPVSQSFIPGELVFLVGGNGSGKTTFANLLTGLYSADSGETILNGHSIGPEDREMYRQQFSVVFSDFFLFDDVVFVHQRTEDEVNRLLRLLQLEHKVSFRQGHFTTTLLSQGQRKRLALIQAWVEQRPFYVFDEWAADQDPEFRNVFYREILPMFKAEGKTVLAITHDDRFFHMADRIIKFDEGKQVLS